MSRMPMTRMPVIGVVGGQGGVGASRFASVLAARAASSASHCVLIDLDPVRGGLDVALEIESRPGARWSGLRLAGGRLDPTDLMAGLPSWGGVSVLAADRPAEAEPAAVEQLIEVARQAGPVVLDLPRWDGEARRVAVARADLLVLVMRADVAGVAGARSVARTIDAPIGVLVRGGRRSVKAIPELVGAKLLGRLPPRSTGGSAARRRVAQVAAGVLDAVVAR